MSQLNDKSDQIKSDNITQEIDTVGIIIYGKQGSGKTVAGICLSLDWKKRIYANFEIYKNGKRINKKLNSVKDVENIRFSYEPGVILIDEAGINANSKDSQSKASRVLQEVLFLVRKKNCSLIWISQRFESIDVNARVLSELILEMKKIRRSKKHPIFKATKQKQSGAKLKFLQQYKMDAIGYMNYHGITYNTLELSKFEKLSKKKNKDLIIED